MAKIVFVHGMRMHRQTEGKLHDNWYAALADLLRGTVWGKAAPSAIPESKDVAVAFWGDLFRQPDLEKAAAATKGVDIAAIKAAYYAFLRSTLRAADRVGSFNDEGRPANAIARWVDRTVYQTAVYMHNGPVYHPDPKAGDGAYHQVQARFRKHLEDARIVIAHSLGTVVAYEGLVAGGHSVDTLITVGSPIATPNLILEPLKQRLKKLRRNLDRGMPWPNVRTWVNIYAAEDVWSVPVKQLAPIFGSDVRDIEVKQGISPLDYKEVHALHNYFRREEMGQEIVRALESAAASDSTRSAS